MNRLSLHTFALAIGALLLTLSMSGCGTLLHPLSDDAVAALIPSGRAAP